MSLLHKYKTDMEILREITVQKGRKITMIKIAYCDDDKLDRDRIMNALNNIEQSVIDKFELFAFDSGEELCKNLKDNSYDIILLDIIMGGIYGVQTAEKVRSMGKSSLIIFISSYDKRLKELFSYGTIAFIDKPLNAEHLKQALFNAINIIKKDKESLFSYNKNGSTYYIPISEIVYFEAMLNHVIIHTINDNISYNKLFKNLWDKLKNDHNFIRPNRSHIYNLKYVILKSNTIVSKTTGDIQNIGRVYKEDTHLRFYQYMECRSE